MAERIFKRKIYSKIAAWKAESRGKSALLIEGARRVGKSTIVSEFARREYKSAIIIDFNKASAQVRGLFEDLMDLDYIFLQLQTIYGTQLYKRESVIVFDEIQKCPIARQAIKYLVADGRYDYIETGSLISIKKNTQDITIPSEEDRIEMYPMDYEEFLGALGDNVSIELLRKFYMQRTPLGGAHRKAQRDLRLYMLVGGMPQAINAYLDTNNLEKVDKVKRSLIRLYCEDFQKVDPTGRLGRMFMNIPAQLNSNAMRYSTAAAAGEMSANVRDEMLMNLEDSKTALVCYHSNDPNVGLSLTRDGVVLSSIWQIRACLLPWHSGIRILQRM